MNLALFRSSRDPIALKNTSALFLVVELLLLFGLTISMAYVGDRFAVATCRFCSHNTFDEGVRRLVVADDRLWAGVWTHRLSVGLLPLLAILGTALPALSSMRKRVAAQDFALILSAFI